jgi:hypothetical protein
MAWLVVMVTASVLILANAVFLVTPAVRSATALAQQGVTLGGLAAGYSRAYGIESTAGGANVVLTLLAMACGVWRFGSSAEGVKE